MARPLSDEELQLRKRARRRLIGAIALVTAVAVVLPMVLDNEPRPVGQDVDIRIPASDSSVFTSKIAPLPAAPQLKPAPQLKEAPATESVPAAAKKEKVPVPEKSPSAKPPSKSTASKAPSGKTAKTTREQFVVQVIALADAEKAKQMQQRIAGAGIKSYTEVVKTAKGDVTRVRAGPFATREAAEKVQKQLKAIGLEGKVVPK